ncbi:MAG: hypothetical protein EZS28_023325, partial [Streblomastix strix]
MTEKEIPDKKEDSSSSPAADAKPKFKITLVGVLPPINKQRLLNRAPMQPFESADYYNKLNNNFMMGPGQVGGLGEWVINIQNEQQQQMRDLDELERQLQNTSIIMNPAQTQAITPTTSTLKPKALVSKAKAFVPHFLKKKYQEPKKEVEQKLEENRDEKQEEQKRKQLEE